MYICISLGKQSMNTSFNMQFHTIYYRNQLRAGPIKQKQKKNRKKRSKKKIIKRVGALETSQWTTVNPRGIYEWFHNGVAGNGTAGHATIIHGALWLCTS